MKGGDEHGALDHELEPALVQSGVENICDAQSLPQATEQERPADPSARDPTGRHVRQQNGVLAVARERGRQPVQLISAIMRSRPAPASRANKARSPAKNGLDPRSTRTRRSRLRCYGADG